MSKRDSIIGFIVNLVIVVLAAIGTYLMFTGTPVEGSLQASGIENFKFYTVLSNVFCGFVALIYLITAVIRKDTDKIRGLKLAALCGVTITFAIVAFMFVPLYGLSRFYQGGNLYFHLLLPLAAFVEFIVPNGTGCRSGMRFSRQCRRFFTASDTHLIS